MGLRLLTCLLGLVSLATPLWADACDLRGGLLTALGAQTEMIRNRRSGQSISDERIAAHRQDRAELALIGTSNAEAGRAARFILDHLDQMDPILTAGSLATLEQHLARPDRQARLRELESAFAKITCQPPALARVDVGDLGLPILPSGRLGTASLTASTLLVFSGLWAVYGIRSRAEALRRRYLVALQTLLTADDETHDVQINNLSRTGAQVNMGGSPVPLKGRRVGLILDGTQAAGRIVWQKDAVAGMAFDKPLDEDLFQALTRAQTPQRPGRVGRRPGDIHT